MPKPGNTDDRVIQAGSMIADNSEENYRTGPVAKDTATDTTKDTAKDAATDTTTDTAKGTSESTDPASTGSDAGGEAGAGSSNTESAISDKLAAQLEQLNTSIKTMGQQGSQPGAEGEPARDYDMELSDLQAKANDGDITYSELIAQSQVIQDAKTNDTVAQAIESYDQRQQVSGVQQKFLEDNPDFTEFVNSEQNQAIQQENPLLDNMSAYFASKAGSATGEVQAMRQELDALKAQVQSSIKGAAVTQTSRIGAEAGADLRRQSQQNSENLSPRDGMLAALNASRQQV